VTAKRIVKHFGKDTLDVFESSIERLTEVSGIAKIKLEQISKAWVEHQEIRNVMLFLQSHDISTLFAVKIYKSYGNNAIEFVKNDPYRLAKDIYGIGFFSADRIALRMGLATNSPQRIEAGIAHVLQSAREEGHCYLKEEQIQTGVGELLSIEKGEAIEAVLREMEKKEELKTRKLIDEENGEQITCYYAHSLYYDEKYISEKVSKLTASSIASNINHLKEDLQTYCQIHHISLSEEQEESVLSIARERIAILTGGPGCGKTTTTKALVGLLLIQGKKVMLAAPTGRASQRMSEVIGIEAKTIHRLLEFDPLTGGFKRNELDPLPADVLIVDECSMLDVHLAASLLKALPPHGRLVLIGDADQLPAVGAGNVLKDMIASGVVPCLKLTKVFRQASESLIISYAHQINKGVVPKVDSPFHRPELWKEKIDCLFIDSEEATNEQLRFISKIKRVMGETAMEEKGEGIKQKVPYGLQGDNTPDTTKDTIQENIVEDRGEVYTTAGTITIPEKFSFVDVDKLLQAQSYSEELKEVVRRVHPWSSLHYGLSAVSMIERLYETIIPKYFGEGTEVQILSPMSKGSVGTASLNKAIQEKVNPAREGRAQLLLGGRIFRVGDRVIQRRNNYELLVFNGDIGNITAVDTEEMSLVVSYKAGKETKEVIYEKEHLVELDLAYAITIHKSQGSEFETVIIPLLSAHFNMLFRNLLYTGITRAKKLVVFVGSRSALSLAVGKKNTSTRQTALETLLKENRGK
jgi:exodeoxyribonuclease V alpha subunit